MRVRYSTDKSPKPTPGKAMGVGQHMIDKGAIMIQSVEPKKQTCSFAIYSHNMSRQIETHHYCSRLHQNFIQCAVYDSDELGARLLDLLLFSLFLFQLSQNSISYSWSPCVQYIVFDDIFETMPLEFVDQTFLSRDSKSCICKKHETLLSLCHIALSSQLCNVMLSNCERVGSERVPGAILEVVCGAPLLVRTQTDDGINDARIIDSRLNLEARVVEEPRQLGETQQVWAIEEKFDNHRSLRRNSTSSGCRGKDRQARVVKVKLNKLEVVPQARAIGEELTKLGP
ncbi:hypothetical protein V8G54_024249 [Vigna mungo]|uniref:Uncharacterized protein n=1 Tax=Vigna mungo TaxID=3915 RepID=A0AAQ3N593_VIGMU